MVSTPSYDPNRLASHSAAEQTEAYNKFDDAEPPELINRAISETYPPGSTFKLINTAAALRSASRPTPSSPRTRKSR